MPIAIGQDLQLDDMASWILNGTEAACAADCLLRGRLPLRL